MTDKSEKDKTIAWRFYLLLFIFFLSGISGLIYETIWARYLKLFLGHAAYAQALVLAVFMSGLALGSWYAGRVSKQSAQLFRLYAIVEIVIGCIALVFHAVFTHMLEISLNQVLPALNNIQLANAYLWLLASCLIAPQSFLLGTTFPLMANAFIQSFSRPSGNCLSLLYFSNSAGATLGVILCGFVLLGWSGLPGTISTAACLNILSGLCVLLIYPKHAQDTSLQARQSLNKSKLIYACLSIALLTGLSSFIYEIIWIRMLSMVLGSSTHAFELMLSAFILGIAIGGYLIRDRIDQFSKPMLALANIQILMGFFAIISIVAYHFSYDLMQILLSELQRDETSYRLHTVLNYLIAVSIMLPVTICAGMTLPLLSNILIKQGYGDQSVANVYAINTVGALFGILLTLFILMPLTGLKSSILIAAGIDMLIGISIFMLIKNEIGLLKKLLVSLTCIILLTSMTLSQELDTKKLVSGVYRFGQARISTGQDILYYEDGKTASIGVYGKQNGVITISTNGKPDASINMDRHGKPTADEITMVMAAALPMMKKDNIHVVANIGFGSGLTSQTLLEFNSIDSLDNIEIESSMVEGARLFKPRVNLAYQDTRSRLHIDDAKVFFSVRQTEYDLIISEPSNPWVSGTSGLFTLEHYQQIKNHLTNEGLLLQWLQTYEMSLELIYSVLKALDASFEYYQLYASNNSDILILASAEPLPLSVSGNYFQQAPIQHSLAKVGINNKRDIQNRFLGDQRLFRPLLDEQTVQTNSDYFPYLDLNAEKARFLRLNARELTEYRTLPFPLIRYLYPDIVKTGDTATDDRFHTISKRDYLARHLFLMFRDNNLQYADEFTDLSAEFIQLLDTKSYENNCLPESDWLLAMTDLMKRTLPYLDKNKLETIRQSIQGRCPTLSNYQIEWLDLFSSLARLNLDEIEKISGRLLQQRKPLAEESLTLLKSILGIAAILNNRPDTTDLENPE